MLVHSVFFYLRADLTPAQREEFLKEGLESLLPIGSVSRAYIGRPAAIPPRPVVDASYDFALTALFETIEAHNAYQVDPVHVAFVNRFKTYWTQVRIYDAE